MTLRHLEIFSAVCAQESFTRAAGAAEYGTAGGEPGHPGAGGVLQRAAVRADEPPVYLTEAGRTLRQYADTVLSQFQESVEVLRESGTQGAWPLRRPRDAGRDPPCGYPGASSRGAA